MKIGILGYGKEGRSVERYFQQHGADTQVFDNFRLDEIKKHDFSDFDLVFRSPSVHPYSGWTSVTRYFFEHCPCTIIGVTGTKGKGTTSSLIAELLKTLGKTVHLVGNIGTPAIDALDRLTPTDVVVYELSSFQLWDLEQSPHIAVLLRIDPDHLNVHDSFADYVQAKANICKHQTSSDYCIFYDVDSDSQAVATESPARKFGYPIQHNTQLDQLLQNLHLPGQHNRENAQAALLAVACYLDLELTDFLQQYQDKIAQTLRGFQGLPHRLQLLRVLNHVAYYDDNFSSAFPALDVALAAFAEHPIFLIAGGQDRGIDHTPARERIFSAPNLKKAFLIGETSSKLTEGVANERYQICTDLRTAVQSARTAAEAEAQAHPDTTAVILMSPGAPSFDMFENFVDRGMQFQKLVQEF